MSSKTILRKCICALTKKVKTNLNHSKTPKEHLKVE